MLTTKVKATGQLFMLGMLFTAEGDVRDPVGPLQAEAEYGGNLLDGGLGESGVVEYSVVHWATFRGSELEEVPGDLRLRRVHGSLNTTGLRPGPEAMGRLTEQGAFILTKFREEFTKDPTGRQAEFWRGEFVSWRETLKRIYGPSLADSMADLVCNRAGVRLPENGPPSRV